jgi:hypothetical protein
LQSPLHVGSVTTTLAVGLLPELVNVVEAVAVQELLSVTVTINAPGHKLLIV